MNQQLKLLHLGLIFTLLVLVYGSISKTEKPVSAEVNHFQTTPTDTPDDTPTDVPSDTPTITRKDTPTASSTGNPPSTPPILIAPANGSVITTNPPDFVVQATGNALFMFVHVDQVDGNFGLTFCLP